MGKALISPIVIDTSVLVSGLFSTKGAAYRLLDLVGEGHFDIAISVPLILEYEEVLRQQAARLELTREDIDALLDMYCARGLETEIYFYWRPSLIDRDDELILELAVAARAPCIVTHNARHFVGASSFGIKVLSPIEYLRFAELLPWPKLD
jgi:putative PIN family toxin of toxin-antitoxin system